MFFLQRLSTPATSILNRGSIQLSATCSGNRWFSEEVQQKRKKKKKRKVDPNAPKRPLTAYTLFVKDSFPRLKEYATDAPSTMKLISQEWNDMTDNEKRPYSMMNERLKNQYTADLKDYKASLPPVLKRPKNAYMVFYQDFIKNQHRSGEPMKITQLAKSASQRWKSMSDSDKGPFTRIAEAEKAKYNMLRAQMQEDEESE